VRAQLIHVLELEHVADWLIGSEDTGIPRGERKRYTIGVELVTNPSVLFLDEPTSGLDSREAAAVMRVIHRIAKNGRTVVATIHVSIPQRSLLSLACVMVVWRVCSVSC
jgi:ABC-type multidrug transport system ATPase subunit